jgi:hypothetical protein
MKQRVIWSFALSFVDVTWELAPNIVQIPAADNEKPTPAVMGASTKKAERRNGLCLAGACRYRGVSVFE